MHSDAKNALVLGIHLLRQPAWYPSENLLVQSETAAAKALSLLNDGHRNENTMEVEGDSNGDDSQGRLSLGKK